MDMARPRKFSREGVLEKALPVFWKHGFADASLQELENGYRGEQIRSVLRVFGQGGAVPREPALLARSTAVARISHSRAFR
jgi:hypothetical protein